MFFIYLFLFICSFLYSWVCKRSVTVWGHAVTGILSIALRIVWQVITARNSHISSRCASIIYKPLYPLSVTSISKNVSCRRKDIAEYWVRMRLSWLGQRNSGDRRNYLSDFEAHHFPPKTHWSCTLLLVYRCLSCMLDPVPASIAFSSYLALLHQAYGETISVWLIVAALQCSIQQGAVCRQQRPLTPACARRYSDHLNIAQCWMSNGV